MLCDPGEGRGAREAERRPRFRMPTVLILLAAGATMLSLMGVGHAATVNVSTPGTAEQGSTFLVTIQVLSVTDLYGAQFSLSFNPTVLEAMSVAEGSFLKQGADTWWRPPTIDNSAGTIAQAAQIRLTVPTGVTGSGDLATISFRAKATGISSLGLNGVALSDPNAQAIPFTIQPGSVTVSPPPPPLVPPDSQITSGPTGTISTSTATFTWTGSDPDGYVASYDFRMDSGTWESTTVTSKTFAGLSKGDHTFYVRARDNDGLPDPTPASRLFTVEYTSNPETEIKAGPNGITEGQTASFEWIGTDMDGRVVSYFYSLDNQTWAPTTEASHTYTNLPYGNHVFRVKAVDDDGLEDLTPAERIFTLIPYWWEGEIDRLNKEIIGLEGQLQAAQAELQEKQVELGEQRARLEGQIESLQTRLDAVQGEKTSLQGQIWDLVSQRNQLAADLHELESWSGELEANMTGLNRRLNASEENYRALSREMDGLTSQLTEKDRELQQTLIDLDRAEREMVVLKAEVGSYANQTAALQQQIQELKADMGELAGAKDGLEAEKKALEIANEAAEEGRVALQEEIDQLRAELSTAEQEMAKADSQRDERQSQIDALEAEKSAVSSNVTVLRYENQSLRETRQILIGVLWGMAVVAIALVGLTVRYRRGA